MPATYQKIKVSESLMGQDAGAYFVYGDNETRQGTDGAAALRSNPRAIGFITKKAPGTKPSACFKAEEYIKPFFQQLKQLQDIIKNAAHQKFYVSKIGSGAANKYYIWERVIRHNLVEALGDCDNVIFCWEE